MFNKKILSILNDYGIRQNEALTTLLIIYYKLEKDNRIMIDEFISELSKCKLIEYDFRKQQYFLTMPLFGKEDESLDNDWITEYMNMFAKINKERRGDKKTVAKRIAKLMQEYHDITPEMILKATELYIKRVRDPQFLKKSHKFIWDEDNGYEILTYINMLKDQTSPNNDRIDDIL